MATPSAPGAPLMMDECSSRVVTDGSALKNGARLEHEPSMAIRSASSKLSS